jgi:hypothetical protein
MVSSLTLVVEMKSLTQINESAAAMWVKTKCRRLILTALMVTLLKFGKFPKLRSYAVLFQVESDTFFTGDSILYYHKENGRITIIDTRRHSRNIH